MEFSPTLDTDAARSAPQSASASVTPSSPPPDAQIHHLADLLSGLDDFAMSVADSELRHAYEDQLVRVRLGVAASLFAALRCKHAPTAAHSLRVGLGCSTWAIARRMPETFCDQIEIAALLHDIGKVGVPDDVLLKPSPLTTDEASLMSRHRRMGLYILLSCCESTEVLQIVGSSPAWFDGSVPGYELAGTALPLGARMLAIVDAFDAMTTDHVYRPAMSRDRAFAELFRFAGTQFDPELVAEFQQLQISDQTGLREAIGRRWLESLQPRVSNDFWAFHAPNDVPDGQPAESSHSSLFHQKLLDNMHDGIVFVGSNLQIFLWNRGAERLTGLAEEAVATRQWSVELVKFTDEVNKPLTDSECPVAYAIQNGVQSLRRLRIAGRAGKPVDVNAHAIPVIGPDGTRYGATLLLHDASTESTLEERCQWLHEKATKDPLTQVANRAEFARVHEQFVQAHLEKHLPCSLIITDLDHFKQINDTYGHPAGDDVLKEFADLLKVSCRPGDLVARYGGEEFVLLCADCNNTSAARRAEQIRGLLRHRPMDALGGRMITASFGVTEIQPGDTPDTMLRRADRALLQAKEQGRDRVVQLGDGIGAQTVAKKRSWWQFVRGAPEVIIGRTLETPVPLKVAVEKLRGFIADHDAQAVSLDQNDVILEVQHSRGNKQRRAADGCVPLSIELSFSEERQADVSDTGEARLSKSRTLVRVTIRPKRHRDLRRAETDEHAMQLLVSLKAYLMAHEVSSETDVTGAVRSAGGLVNWFTGRD
jgi:diguanylate cyclase (GGDEF)-like protein/PAS domain S-box-containing protein